MSRKSLRFALSLLLICSAIPLMAQRAASADSVVPAMVKFSGTLADNNGRPLTGTVGATFLLYKEETGGATLWMETQNVQADKNGHYSLMLGSASAHGLPSEMFVAGEARWLGVQVSGQSEQPRTLLLSVPYALKALDAETLGGKPASAFLSASGSGAGGGQAGPQAEQSNEIVCSSATACKAGFIPLFSTNGGSAKMGDSIVTQSGSTVTISGSENITGNESVAGNFNANAITAAYVQGGNFSPFVNAGVVGANSIATGVFGETEAVGSQGVLGDSAGSEGFGVLGLANGTGVGAAGNIGTFGKVAQGIIGTVPVGVLGDSNGYGVAATSDAGNALIVGNNSTSDTTVILANGGGAPIYAQGTGGSLFLDGNGNLSVSGAIYAGTKDFKIDHPLDPANRYLYHASVESSKMMNIYAGNVTTDAHGNARVELPDWFQAVNGDFRYQLTVIGQFAQAIIAGK